MTKVMVLVRKRSVLQTATPAIHGAEAAHALLDPSRLPRG